MITIQKWKEELGKAFRIAIIGLVIAFGSQLATGWYDSVQVVLQEPTINLTRHREIKDRFDKVEETASIQVAEMYLELSKLKEGIQNTRDDIEALRRPKDIFEVSKLSGAVEGFCVAGKPCVIYVKARRTKEGKDCKIVPGKTVHRFVNPRTDDVRIVRRVSTSGFDSNNISTDWSDLFVTVIPPVDFEPEGAYFFEPFYHNCFGDGDNTLISEPSRMILIPLKKQT